MRIEIGDWSTKCYMATINVDAVPRVGELLDLNLYGLRQVMQVVWHTHKTPTTVTMYVQETK